MKIPCHYHSEIYLLSPALAAGSPKIFCWQSFMFLYIMELHITHAKRSFSSDTLAAVSRKNARTSPGNFMSNTTNLLYKYSNLTKKSVILTLGRSAVIVKFLKCKLYAGIFIFQKKESPIFLIYRPFLIFPHQGLWTTSIFQGHFSILHSCFHQPEWVAFLRLAGMPFHRVHYHERNYSFCYHLSTCYSVLTCYIVLT